MIAVVGAGVAGLATAWALARGGADVTLLEQFEVGHPHGSSHGTSRIFRLSYPEPEWVALAQEALVLWRELEDETGTQLLDLNGLVDAVHDVDPRVEALAARGVPCETVGGAEAAERFGLVYEANVRLLFQPDAGIALAADALAAFGGAGSGRGVDLRERTEVQALHADGSRVVVETSAGELIADAAVVTAGAWAGPLVAGLGIGLPVTVTRESVAYFTLEDDWGPPSVIDELDGVQAGRSFYALRAPGVGLKVGAHHAGAVVEPGTPGEPDASLVAAVAAWVERRCPRAVPEPIRAETCLYTSTADERFVLQRHGRVVVGSACSGHGFKFAPAVGERLSRLALEAARG